jgi:hypothetical protein
MRNMNKTLSRVNQEHSNKLELHVVIKVENKDQKSKVS